MGVQGLWNELRPFGHRTDTTADLSERVKTLTDLQGQILAVDLSFWICENVGTYNHPVMGQLSAVVAKPHLRNLFYRTVKLVSRIGALPVFVVDGDAPSLKMRERIKRYHTQHNLRMPDTLGPERSGTVRRNVGWEMNVQECVDLLRLMGLPVIFAKAEAEALCAQLNAAGYVDACVSPDSDAFLYGAQTLIKELAVDLSKPVIDRYEASEIADQLGLKRPHLVALALLLGCDFDSQGVKDCGPKRAIKLLQNFLGDEVLDRLRAMGRGEKVAEVSAVEVTSAGRKPAHCGKCGHPGKSIEHRKGGCDGCGTEDGGCGPKEKGFVCACESCVQEKAAKAKRQDAAWWGKTAELISQHPNFPNEEIIRIFMQDEPQELGHLRGGQAPLEELLTWHPPRLTELGAFLTAKCEESDAHWQLKALPLATAQYLCQVMIARYTRGDLGCMRQCAELTADPEWKHNPDALSQRPNPPDDLLLDGSFQPSRIERLKIDATEALYRVEWQRVAGESGHALLQQGLPADDSGKTEGQQKKVVLEWRKASGFVSDEQKIMVEKAFPRVAAAFEKQRNASLHEKAQKEAAREVRKAERAAKAALKQTDIKSFFATKKGGGRTKAKANESTPRGSLPGKQLFAVQFETEEEDAETKMTQKESGGEAKGHCRSIATQSEGQIETGRRAQGLKGGDPSEREGGKAGKIEDSEVESLARRSLEGSERSAALLDSLPESPHAKHPGADGFVKLAELRRRLTAMSPPRGKLKSAENLRPSAASDSGGDFAKGEVRKTKQKSSLSDCGTQGSDACKQAGLERGGELPRGFVQGTRELPVEIGDSPLGEKARELLEPATAGNESDIRATTPVRKCPEKAPGGASSPITPSKRPAECPVEHTPPKRLAEVFERAARDEKGLPVKEAELKQTAAQVVDLVSDDESDQVLGEGSALAERTEAVAPPESARAFQESGGRLQRRKVLEIRKRRPI